MRNQTQNITGSANESNFTLSDSTSGVFLWNCQAFSSTNTSAFADTNATFSFTGQPTSSGGGAGGGGKVGSCLPSWSCTIWTPCRGSFMTRTCTDAKNCGEFSSKPAERESCNCFKEWICSDWGGCIDGLQRRACQKEPACYKGGPEPKTARPCEKTTEFLPPEISAEIERQPPAPIHVAKKEESFAPLKENLASLKEKPALVEPKWEGLRAFRNMVENAVHSVSNLWKAIPVWIFIGAATLLVVTGMSALGYRRYVRGRMHEHAHDIFKLPALHRLDEINKEIEQTDSSIDKKWERSKQEKPPTSVANIEKLNKDLSRLQMPDTDLKIDRIDRQLELLRQHERERLAQEQLDGAIPPADVRLADIDKDLQLFRKTAIKVKNKTFNGK